jgi:hypothetical protein
MRYRRGYLSEETARMVKTVLQVLAPSHPKNNVNDALCISADATQSSPDVDDAKNTAVRYFGPHGERHHTSRRRVNVRQDSNQAMSSPLPLPWRRNGRFQREAECLLERHCCRGWDKEVTT